MKVLVATGLYFPEGGGPAKHTMMMEQELPKHGVEVNVMPFSHVRRYPKGIRHLFYTFLLIHEALHADIIFAQDTVSVGFPAAIASFITRAKLVVRVPGDHAWEQGKQRYGVKDSLEVFQTRKYGRGVERLRSIARWTVNQAHMVIVPSEYLSATVRPWLKDPSRLRMIRNGVTQPVVAVMPSDRPSGTLIVSLGRQTPWKHFDAIIDLLTEEKHWQLALVGDGPEHEQLRERAEKLGVAGRVIFVPPPHEEAMGWCASADVFVLNSSYEGMSHVLVEVMSLGIPTVATDIPGNAELLRDGIEGKLVPVGDQKALLAAVRELVNDRVKAEEMGERAIERAHLYDVKRTGKELALALKEVCAF